MQNDKENLNGIINSLLHTVPFYSQLFQTSSQKGILIWETEESIWIFKISKSTYLSLCGVFQDFYPLFWLLFYTGCI